MTWSGRVVRDGARSAHLVEAAVLAAYLYTPVGEVEPARAFARFALVPAMLISGLMMWKVAALRRLWRVRVQAHG